MNAWFQKYKPIVLLCLILAAIVVMCTGCYAMVRYSPHEDTMLKVLATWAWQSLKVWLGTSQKSPVWQFWQVITWVALMAMAYKVITTIWSIASYPWKIWRAIRKTKAPVVQETNLELQAELLYGTVPPGYLIYMFKRPVINTGHGQYITREQIISVTDRWQHPSQYATSIYIQVIAMDVDMAINKINKYARERRTEDTY
jgi:hypothetical protein